MAKKKGKKGKINAGQLAELVEALTRDKSDAGARLVAIDIDIHRMIESGRRTFEESDNTILRRLLGLASDAAEQPVRKQARLPSVQPFAPLATGGRAKSGGIADGGWSKTGRHGRNIFLADGTELRAAYAGQTITGMIEDGKWTVGGEAYGSPSAALNAHARTREGKPVNLNGWRLWEVKQPGSDLWIRLGEL